MSIFQTPNGKWRVSLGSGAKRRTKVFATKREADRFLLLEEDRLKNLDQTTWGDLAAVYFESSKFDEKANKTKPTEKRACKPVLAHFADRLVVETTEDDVDAYKELRLATVSSRTGGKLSGNTVRLELSFLAVLAKIALRKRIIRINPCALVEKPKCDERDIRINDSELSIIFQTLSKWANFEPLIHHTYFYMLFAIGCRPSELAELTYDDVSLKNRQIRFKRTKNTKSRTVPVASNDFHELIVWLRRKDRPDMLECPYVFPCKKRNGNWAPYDFSNSWNTLRKKIGNLINPEITPHAFRHERISRWFEQTDMNEGQIMELSGHLTAAALNRYRHIRAENFRGQIEVLRNKDTANLTDAFAHVYKNGIPTERPTFEDELKMFWNDAVDELEEK